MSFHEFYEKWQDREIKIKFKSIKDRVQYYLNWLFVVLSLALSAGVYYLSFQEIISNLIADVLIAILMCIFLYLVLFGTKIMKKKRCELYEEHRILIKIRSR